VGVVINGCRSLLNSGHGFHYRHSGQSVASPDSSLLVSLTMENCFAAENTGSGISLTGATSPDPVFFLNFILSGNTCDSNEESGIVVEPAIWQLFDQNIVVSILGNRCLLNEKFQISIGQSGAVGNPGEVAVICRNNDCSLGGDFLDGVIKVITPGGGPLDNLVALTDMPQGLHTMLVAPAGGGDIQKRHENEGNLVENAGDLETI